MKIEKIMHKFLKVGKPLILILAVLLAVFGDLEWWVVIVVFLILLPSLK